MAADGGAIGARTPATLFLILGACAALAFTFATPPFQVPDEVGHFWRAASIAHGTITPETTATGTFAPVPEGIRSLVYIFWKDPVREPRATVRWSDFRTATYLRLGADHPVSVRLPGVYTTFAYLPQVTAALIGRATGALPLVTFYLGRLLSATVFVLIVWWAIRMTPVLPWAFFLVALFPMTLSLAASWSADAMTIALTFFLTAALLRATRFPLRAPDLVMLCVAGALVGLCKPGYGVVALLVLAIPRAQKRRTPAKAITVAAVLLATIAGSTASMTNAAHARVTRSDLMVDPQAQVDCLRRDVLHAASLVVHEYVARGWEYLEQAIGRLGMLDVRLPSFAIWIAALLLAVSAFATDASPPWLVRLMAGIVFMVACIATALTLYVSWTAPCASRIEGIQGRYFIPILPLGLAVFTAPVLRRVRPAAFVFGAGALLVDLTAVATLASRYWL